MTSTPAAPTSSTTHSQAQALGGSLDGDYLADETEIVTTLIRTASVVEEDAQAICDVAAELVRGVRRRRDDQSGVQELMNEYDLSSTEGVLLMCLAEALLRIPDHDTAEKLIGDKLGDADWKSHLGRADSVFVNASTWGLMLTGKLIQLDRSALKSASAAFGRLLAGSSEPVVRAALRRAMKLMGSQFVLGRTITEAMTRAKADNHRVHARHSFDMLGEAALTADDAKRYLDAYADAIERIGNALGATGDVVSGPGISVKLSALHPRYEFTQFDRAVTEITPLLKRLALLARKANIGLTVDAEEADRLQLGLAIFERVYNDRDLAGWDGLGLALQAYQKRALGQVDAVIAFARKGGRRIPVRLVKGAYWDTEIKRAQEQGLPGYPVFTRKTATDTSYLACARRLLAARDVIYPQFATHNAHTVAAVLHYAGESAPRFDAQNGFEFQRLHGMGEALYAELRTTAPSIACRVYAPVGSHEELLPYLVRRLLENGANTSFVNQIMDDAVPVESIVTDPISEIRAAQPKPHPAIPTPREIFPDRPNSTGLNLPELTTQLLLSDAITSSSTRQFSAGVAASGQKTTDVLNPARRTEIVGQAIVTTEQAVQDAIARAAEVSRSESWADTPVAERAAILDRAGDALDAGKVDLIALLVREAGKTWADAIAEVREAADFCHYYAAQARARLATPQRLPGYTGEANTLRLAPRGVICCISPWNFPLAIFTGQVAAALVTGNAVLAKPAEQTPLVAQQAIDIFLRAGVPAAALQLLPGDGAVGAALTSDPRVNGVAFTGSLPTAKAIAKTLAERPGAIAPLVAETGGLNCMIIDSSALPEQVIRDTVQSAFGSAGQRCSATRVLLVQEDVAPRILTMLKGAIKELVVGDPAKITTDIGPVIDNDALNMLRKHAARMDDEAELIGKAEAPDGLTGTFFAPRAYRVQSLKQIGGETFGPILHVLTWKAGTLDEVIEQINDSGYGLTLGVHSRIESTWQKVVAKARVGNCYVNRNMIGAIVGVQPFGGEGLSGTGPKAGGPHYLERFCNERTLTVNTTAVGGNASLLTMQA